MIVVLSATISVPALGRCYFAARYVLAILSKFQAWKVQDLLIPALALDTRFIKQVNPAVLLAFGLMRCAVS